jgi:hypothetical protein
VSIRERMAGEAGVNDSENAPVLVLDLRAAPPESAKRKVFEVLNNYQHRDATRVLVIDDSAAAQDNHSVYAAVAASRLVHWVLCVLVGPPVGRDRGQALRTTPVFDRDDSATLWVGDTDGIGWRVALDAAATPASSTGPDDGLAELLGMLCTGEVFDAVLKALRDFPGKIASPGYLVTNSTIDRGPLLAAEVAALTRLAGPEQPDGEVADLTPDPADGGPAGVLDRLLGRVDAAQAEAAQALRLGSPLDRLHLACQDRIGALGTELHLFVGVRQLFRAGQGRQHRQAASAAAVDAGAALADFRQAVADLLGTADGRTGLSPAALDGLRRQGVELSTPDIDPAGMLAWLRHGAWAALDRGYPLRTLISWLRDVADRVAPQGSSGYLARLNRACPDRLLDGLRRPPPARLAPLAPWMATVVVLCCALAGLGGRPGALVGGLLALGWVFGAWRASTLLAGRADRTRLGRLGRQLALAGGGAVAGIAVGAALHVPAALTPTAVVAATGLGLVLARWWRESVLAWGARLDVTGAGAAAAGVHAIVREAGATEWALSELRTSTAEMARAAANALLHAARVCTDRADARSKVDSGGAADPAGPVRSADGARPAGRPGAGLGGDVDGELTRIVHADLVDLIRASIDDGCWETFQTGAADRPMGWLADRVAVLLDGYEDRLDRHGPQESPMFARVDQRRDQLTRMLWRDNPAATGVLRAVAGDPMRQLCLADDISFLDRTAPVPVVRFAPRAAQPVLGDSQVGPDVQWTPVGHQAGAVRLVPLRTGAVESSWPVGPDDKATRQPDL